MQVISANGITSFPHLKSRRGLWEFGDRIRMIWQIQALLAEMQNQKSSKNQEFENEVI